MQYTTLPLTIANGVYIALGVYNSIYPAKKPPASYLLKEAVGVTVKVVSACKMGGRCHPLSVVLTAARLADGVALP